LVDYDNDGIPDIISGSYDPGDVWLFRGLGKGRYEAGQVLHDETGVPLVHHPKELQRFEELRKLKGEQDNEVLQARVASFGSWPAPVDWDGDGDLDLLIGSFDGHVHLRLNVGTRKEPKYATASPQVMCGAEPLKVAMHAAPVVADWNGDGKWDLVVGSGDGSVWFFENRGSKEKPEFAAGVALVPPRAKTKFLRQILLPGDEQQPGVRAQVCVVDFDLDGKLDLLVGDYVELLNARNDLSPEQRAELVDADRQERQMMEGTYDEALGEKLAAVRNRLCSGETRRASAVWFYRRIAP
jgi:hypothetical protein